MFISLIVFGNIHMYFVIVLVVALSLRRPQNGKWYENVCVCGINMKCPHISSFQCTLTHTHMHTLYSNTI